MKTSDALTIVQNASRLLLSGLVLFESMPRMNDALRWLEAEGHRYERDTETHRITVYFQYPLVSE